MNQKIFIDQQTFKVDKTYLINQTLSVVLGSIFLGLMAQVAFHLPWTPIPVTLQTLGVSLLALALGPYRAFFAVLAYLGQATIGLPVIAGGVSNPLWMIGPTAGYLMGFLIASYVTGQLLKKKSSYSLFQIFCIFIINEGIILSSGSAWLFLFLKQTQAFQLGFLPFIPGALCKACLATSLLYPIEWIRAKK